MEFRIESQGITIGPDTYPWQKIVGFTIKRGDPYAKLLIQTSRHFLPVFTIPVPPDLVVPIRDSLEKVAPTIQLEESSSILFMEKLGF
jgi:hypothetical protein